MSAHSYHPDSHTNGLADDCERCAEHAENLDSLDQDNLRALYERRLRVEAGMAGAVYRSQAEARASYNLGRAIRIYNRLLRMGAIPFDP